MSQNSFQTTVTPPARPLSGDFCLGEWQVLPSLNSLRHTRSGEERHLEPRLMHLLCFLAANQPRLLTREELTRELWPRVVVNENSLTRAISELRKQLATAALPGQRCVHTIAKRGYRLAEGLKVGAVPANSRPAYPRVRAVAVSTALAASLALALGITLWLPPSGQSPAVPIASQPVYDRVVQSPDDFDSALLTLSGGQGGLYNAVPATTQPQPGEKPVVSADGSTLAFIRYDSNGSTVYLGSVDSAKPPVALFTSKDHLYNLSWSPVGQALLFAASPVQGALAVLDNRQRNADLIMLDLESLEIRVLLDRGGRARIQSQRINLT